LYLLRRLAGLWLLVRLAVPYVCALHLRRIWHRPARAWLASLHRRGARRLARFIHRNGGLQIKIGQYIASRPDFFPLPYIDSLAPLRDQVPPRPIADLRPQLEDAYEGRVDEHLAHVEETPIAAASFGQVHRARLASGEEVAVKIQYPDLGPSVVVDLWLARLAIRVFRRILPGWPLQMIYEEIERTCRDEQDYLHEGLAADRLREPLAKHGIDVPRVLWEHTREKVLVMEFARGEPFTRVDWTRVPLGAREGLADKVVDGYLEMLLECGYFHADPHAGNFLLRDDGGVWLLDFGMTATISDEEASAYREYLSCLRRHDTDGMIDALARVGYLLPGADMAQVKGLAREVYSELAHLNPRTFKGSRRQLDLASKINTFLRRMRGIAFPRHTVLLARATGLLESICMDLLPDRNVLDVLRPRIRRFLGPRVMARRLAADLVRIWDRLRRDPPRPEPPPPAPATTAGPVPGLLLILIATQLEPGLLRLVVLVGGGLAGLLGIRRSSTG